MKDDGISIGVTITESQNTSAGADVTILVGQMQQDVSYITLYIDNTQCYVYVFLILSTMSHALHSMLRNKVDVHVYLI